MGPPQSLAMQWRAIEESAASLDPGCAAELKSHVSCGCCRQMVAKMAEAERVRAAGDAYKRELLQARLAEREGELSQAQDRLKTAKREAASAGLLTR